MNTRVVSRLTWASALSGLTAYQLDGSGEPGRRLGYLPKDAPRREGSYLATLRRPAGKKRIEGKLAPLQAHEQS